MLAPTRVQPDGRHRSAPELTHVRLDIHPDGGVGRLRVWGDLTEDGERALRDRWDAVSPP